MTSRTLTQRAARAAALDVLGKAAGFIRPGMRCSMGISAYGRISLHLDSDDPDDGRELAEIMHLVKQDRSANDHEYIHHVWAGDFRGHQVSVVVLTPNPKDQRAAATVAEMQVVSAGHDAGAY